MLFSPLFCKALIGIELRHLGCHEGQFECCRQIYVDGSARWCLFLAQKRTAYFGYDDSGASPGLAAGGQIVI
jgi:hypothetical protein